MDAVEISEVVVNRALTPRVRGVTVARPDGWSWRAGQHAHVRADHGTPSPYSIANAPCGDVIEFAVVCEDEDSSQGLAGAQAGDRVGVEGPFGDFGLICDGRQGLFVATGTGLAPIRALVQALRDRPRDVGRHDLLFGCRTPRDVIWPHELHRWVQDGVLGQVTICYSREGGSGDVRGHVQEHLPNALSPLNGPRVYLCGQPSMVSEVTQAATTVGVAPVDIHPDT